MIDAVVVGSGPNGLTAAVAIARAGFGVHVVEANDEIGGGARSAELTLPGLTHDVCSGIHPFAAGSPFFRSLGLEAEGLRWRYAEVDCAHPFDGGRAAALYRDIGRTAAELGGRDGRTWRRTFAPSAARFDGLTRDLLRPLVRVPRHPVAAARFGIPALLPATVVANRWRTPEARGLFAGCAAHSIHPLTRPTTSAIGMMLIAASHAVGWPVAEGGSRAITDALAARLSSLGGTIETGLRVTSIAQLPPSRVVLLDLSPRDVVRVAGDRLPGRVAHALARYRYGPGAFKLDLAVDGGVPWTADACRRAITVHVGGTLEEIADSEAQVHRGEMPRRPFLLVGQQYLADPARSKGAVHPVWAYAHVPAGYTGDATEAILAQIERFAPGFRERILATHVSSPADIERHNVNYIGGDISTGANNPMQVLLKRPRLALDPYGTGTGNVFICSAATPPGAGVHGMCGANAARSALKRLR